MCSIRRDAFEKAREGVQHRSISPDGRTGNFGQMERYNQVAKETRQTIAGLRKRFAGSNPARSTLIPTVFFLCLLFPGQSEKIVRYHLTVSLDG